MDTLGPPCRGNRIIHYLLLGSALNHTYSHWTYIPCLNPLHQSIRVLRNLLPPFHHLSNDSFTLSDSLAPLVLPVDPVDINNTDTKMVTRLWPSCIPLYTLAELSYLQGRKDRIIKILRHGRNKKLGNGLQAASARVLTHHQYTHTFSEETRMLDRLLMAVFTCTTFTKDVVYKMDENLYQELCTKLTTRCAIASSSLKAFGYSELRPPVWAIDTMKGLTANDFEIYALQYPHSR